MSEQPETRFKKQIRPQLDALPNSWWFKTQLVALIGIPDIIGCLNGRFVALELKKDEKSLPSKMQLHVLNRIQAAGGIGVVVTPGSWDFTYQMLRFLAEEKRCPT